MASPIRSAVFLGPYRRPMGQRATEQPTGEAKKGCVSYRYIPDSLFIFHLCHSFTWGEYLYPSRGVFLLLSVGNL